MLSVPPPTRVALGTLQVGGQRVELFLSSEWARYFESLNTQVQASAADLAQVQANAVLFGEGSDVLDAPISLPGARGVQGDPGLALFMLQDGADEQPVPVPPCIDGVYIPLNTKDASGGVPGLTLFKLNLKNVAGTITSWFSTAATVARTWTMPDKDGTVAVLTDFAAPPAIGDTTAAAGTFTTVRAQSTLDAGKLGTAGLVQIRRAADGLVSGTDTMVGNTREIDNQAGDIVIKSGSNERIRAVPAGATITGSATISGGFGCNGKAAQTAAVSGGTLAGVIAALVANGILSS